MIPINDVFLRLLVSLLFGGILGLEREYHDKPAGFATNTLICLGSTVFALLSIHSAQAFGGDPARIAAQIVAGVGFLGAGSILREGNKISGLTTAAGIWVVAAIGMALGYGEFTIAGLATMLVLILQLFVRKLTNAFDFVKTYDTLTIKCDPDWAVVEKINAAASANGAEILKQEVYKEEGQFVIKMVTNMSPKNFKETFKDLLSLKEIKSLEK